MQAYMNDVWIFDLDLVVIIIDEHTFSLLKKKNIKWKFEKNMKWKFSTGGCQQKTRVDTKTTLK